MRTFISTLSKLQLLRKNFPFYRIHDDKWIKNTHLSKLYDTVGHRLDIYSLGKILYEAICGKIGEKRLLIKTASLADADTPSF